jgi:hypothetical protein
VRAQVLEEVWELAGLGAGFLLVRVKLSPPPVVSVA